MAFSYTGSALNSLVDGLTNNASPVVTLFNDVKTYINGTSWVDDTALVSPNNVTYKQIIPSVVTQLQTSLSGQTFLLSEIGQDVPGIQAGSSTAGGSVFYIDPADYTAGAKTNKYRLRVSLLTNATAPTSTFTVGLYPVSAVAGGANANSITLGAVTAGSTVAFAAPASSTPGQGNSGDFTAPVAGYYAVACAVTVANMAANSAVVMRAILQHRQV